MDDEELIEKMEDGGTLDMGLSGRGALARPIPVSLPSNNIISPLNNSYSNRTRDSSNPQPFVQQQQHGGFQGLQMGGTGGVFISIALPGQLYPQHLDSQQLMNTMRKGSNIAAMAMSGAQDE
ncbi:hypothetical protein BGX29_001875, partial [Mortierella sp. GBA35]